MAMIGAYDIGNYLRKLHDGHLYEARYAGTYCCCAVGHVAIPKKASPKAVAHELGEKNRALWQVFRPGSANQPLNPVGMLLASFVEGVAASPAHEAAVLAVFPFFHIQQMQPMEPLTDTNSVRETLTNLADLLHQLHAKDLHHGNVCCENMFRRRGAAGGGVVLANALFPVRAVDWMGTGLHLRHEWPIEHGAIRDRQGLALWVLECFSGRRVHLHDVQHLDVRGLVGTFDKLTTQQAGIVRSALSTDVPVIGPPGVEAMSCPKLAAEFLSCPVKGGQEKGKARSWWRTFFRRNKA